MLSLFSCNPPSSGCYILKFQRQNPFAIFPLQKLHHYYGFFRTYDIRPCFHTRIFVSLYFSFSTTSQNFPVPFMSLCYAPVASTPTAVHIVNRFLMDSSRQSHNFPVLTIPISINDTSSALHFRSASWHPTDSFFSAFSHTLNTIAFDYSTYECFAICACTPIAEDLLPPHEKHCFSVTKISLISYSIQNTLCVKLLLSIWTSSCVIMGFSLRHYSHYNTGGF